MKCSICNKWLPAKANFCPNCGTQAPIPTAPAPKANTKSRGNGQGTAYKENNKWTVCKTIGYEPCGEAGKVRRIFVRKRGFATKTEALNYLPKLTRAPSKVDQGILFKNLYALWEENYLRLGRSKSTLNCYRSALKHFAAVHYMRFAEIAIDDLQECIDECEKGRRTRENMKTLAGLLYKFALPRGYLVDAINLAEYIIMSGESGTRRLAFDDAQLAAIRAGVGVVPYADYIYCQCYIGFRPSEFLALNVSDYNHEEKYVIGGAKTEAGTNRTVTISPKISVIIDRLVEGRTDGAIFGGPMGAHISDKKYREDYFYPALQALGIDNPIDPATNSHKYTPHCCRHTFATLMKRVQAADKDKLELIGHTSTEQLGYYQHVNLDDLRKITNEL